MTLDVLGGRYGQAEDDKLGQKSISAKKFLEALTTAHCSKLLPPVLKW